MKIQRESMTAETIDSNVNVRSGPGTSHRVVRVVPPSTRFKFTRFTDDGEPVQGSSFPRRWHYCHALRGWISHAVLRNWAPAPRPESQEVTMDSPLLAQPRAGAAVVQRFMLARPHGEYTEGEVRYIVRLYFGTARAVGLDPLIAVAQMVHETGSLTSYWSQRPRRNPAGIGVTGQPGAGVSFPSWRAAVRAHLGRLLAYAIRPGKETDAQRALIEEALRVRPLPNELRGLAPTLRGLTGTWGMDPAYSEKVCRVANAIRQSKR